MPLNRNITPVMYTDGDGTFPISIFNRYSVRGEIRSGIIYAKGDATFLYSTSQLRFQGSSGKKGEKAQYGYFGKISIINVSGEIGLGSNVTGVNLKGVIDIGTANLFIGYIEKDDGWFTGLAVEASVVSVRGGIQVNLGELGIEVGGSAKVLTTGEFTVGFGSDGFVFSLGNPGLFGFSIYIRISW